jgi:hypothetical protein
MADEALALGCGGEATTPDRTDDVRRPLCAGVTLTLFAAGRSALNSPWGS